MMARSSEGSAMLRHTFCHLPGVGEKTERRLWEAGLTSWDAVLEREAGRPPAAARRLPVEHLRDSIRQHAAGDTSWFAQRLPAAQSWRLFRDFPEGCAYLDIETTGMAAFDHVTTIALYDGRTVRHYVHGRNLHDFARDVRAYRLLVTFNGKSFDLPFLERALGVRLEQAHIDLRHVLKSLGYSGGLKNCERQLGLERPGMEGMDGWVAVLLWREYLRKKDARALESLLAYNVQDTLNLETLMVEAYNRKLAELEGVPFAAGYRLPAPAAARNPFMADGATVQRVLRANPWFRPFAVDATHRQPL
jgi:uncharacterized protein YprB with RNaseH-like and TPR domain